MSKPPRSLIQIHYHNRLGGVRQVMEQYAAAFRRTFNSEADDYWFCRVSDQYQGESHLVDIADADYHSFRTVGGFQKRVAACRKQLMTAFTTVSLQYPVTVVGHNLNLGKNPALSEAFRQCACELGKDPDRFRFFLVMHDFAEQGRLDLLQSLRRLETSGIDVYSSLYASGAPVHYLTLNKKWADMTELGKVYCSVLPNNVTSDGVQSSLSSANSVHEQLLWYAKRHRIAYKHDNALFCYPSRMIYRKNLLEALLLATVVWDGTLVTGTCGTAAGDLKMFRIAQDIAKQYALSFIADPSDITGKHSNENPFISLYKDADFVLSSSVAEGFGYGLHEPWSFRCPVICRHPAGTSFLPGLKMSFEYMKLPVPVSWININDVYERVSAAFRSTYQKTFQSKRQFMSQVVSGETIDFAQIGLLQQAAVVRRILKSDSSLTELVALLRKRHAGWPGIYRMPGDETVLTEHNYTLVSGWNRHGFDNEFVKTFKRPGITIAPEKWYNRINEYFSKPENFQPLVFSRYSTSSQSE